MGFVLFADDVHAQLNAFIADEYSGSGYQFSDFVLTFSTERAIKCVLGIAAARFVHWPSSLDIGQLLSILGIDCTAAQSIIWVWANAGEYALHLLIGISLAAIIIIIAISTLIAVIIFYRTLGYHFVNKPEFHGFLG
jgi:hypothetical protein